MRIGILMSVAFALALEFQGSACGHRNSRSAVTTNQSPATANASNERNMNSQENKQQSEEIWGGEHIAITISCERARVEFDCAHGEISRSLKTDVDGPFDLPGTFTRESAGPTRSDQMPSARTVNYRGKIEGNTMTLSINFSDDNESVGSYTLTRGKHGRIRKCM